MSNYVKKTVDMLTNTSVSILTQEFYDTEDGAAQVGDNFRCTYINSVGGRKLLVENESEEVVTEVMEVWGDLPTVEWVEPDENYVPKPTTGERITQLEEQVAVHEENDAELLYQICLLQLGITEDELIGEEV